MLKSLFAGVLVVLLLLMVPAVAAQEGACTATIMVPEDVGVGVYGLPSLESNLVATLQNGDVVLVEQRIGKWLLVSFGEASGYMSADAAELSGNCSFEFDAFPDWLSAVFVTLMVSAQSVALAPVVAYLSQFLKLAAQVFGLKVSGGKIAVAVGIAAVVLVMAANILGFVDQLPKALSLLETVLAAVITIFLSFKSFDTMVWARIMPGESKPTTGLTQEG